MDDDEIVRDIAGKMLCRIGYEVECAVDGAEALEVYEKAMKTGGPIMGLTVPGGMGGREAVEKLLAMDPCAGAVVSGGPLLFPPCFPDN